MSEVVTEPTGEVVLAAGGAGEVRERRCRTEHGMVSAEWAVGLIAAIGVAGVLLAVVTNGAVKSALLRFILTVIKAFANGL
jgi:hypothetical protein